MSSPCPDAAATAALARAERVSAGIAVPGLTRRREQRAFVPVYLAVVAGNLPGRAAARAVGRHHRSVQRMLRNVEDLRDRPEVDAALTHLESRYARAV